MFATMSVAPRHRGKGSLVAGVVVLAVSVVVGGSPVAAQAPEMHPGKTVRPPRVVQEKERLEVDLETSIGELNRAIAETEQALARLKRARRAARESLRALRGEITRPTILRLPEGSLRERDSLYERGILLFPDDVERAMMGQRGLWENAPRGGRVSPREVTPPSIRWEDTSPGILPPGTAPPRIPDE